MQKIQLYHGSLFRYDGLNSPYLYPRYGLGELPQVHWGGAWAYRGGPMRRRLSQRTSLSLTANISVSAHNQLTHCVAYVSASARYKLYNDSVAVGTPPPALC